MGKARKAANLPAFAARVRASRSKVWRQDEAEKVKEQEKVDVIRAELLNELQKLLARPVIDSDVGIRHRFIPRSGFDVKCVAVVTFPCLFNRHPVGETGVEGERCDTENTAVSSALSAALQRLQSESSPVDHYCAVPALPTQAEIICLL